MEHAKDLRIDVWQRISKECSVYPDHVISVYGLVRTYGEKAAVDGISFHVRKGEIFGFLGPNGAGKTTTIKVLTTLIPPTKGKVEILGYDVTKDPLRVRRRIGVVQQQPSLEMFMTVEQNLDSSGFLWDVPKEERKNRIHFLTELFGLKECLRTKGAELSVGQRRRVQVARELMHDMDVLFLDEPTVGLDPQVRRTFLDYTKMRAREGLTVFFTTHIMEEAEYLCDRVAVIDHGKILALDTVEKLRAKFGYASLIELTLAEKTKDISDLMPIQGVIRIYGPQEDGAFRVSVEDPSVALPRLLDALFMKGLHVTSVNVKESSLEEAFLRLTSREKVEQA
jgi:ABC-2 type transport system ATP-binding protein